MEPAKPPPPHTHTQAPPKLQAAQQRAYPDARCFPVLSRLNSFTDTYACNAMHAVGSRARYNSMATSTVEGPGGDATFSDNSGVEALQLLGSCDAAPLDEVLLKLIVREESSRKRHQLGRVLGGILKEERGNLKEERSVVSALRRENELLLKRTKLLKPPAGPSATSTSSGGGFGSSGGGFGSSSSGGFDREFGGSGGLDGSSNSGFWGGGFGSDVEFDSRRFGGGVYATDDGASTGGGYGDSSDSDPSDDDGPAPAPMTSLTEDELADASDRYRDTVYVRNLWEAYVRRESWEPPSRVRLRRDLSQWTEPRDMLREFESAEIPKIRAGRASRRHGWRQFLLSTPTLRSGLQHHAKWGPELDKQVQGVLDLRLVAHESALWSAYHDKHDKLYRQPPKSDRHFSVGPLSRQQVAALQCLGEYRRLLYVAVDESGGPDSFLGSDVYPCVCAYCLAAGPNRSLVYRNQKVPPPS